MKIIFIHGMHQQNYNAQQLKQHWIDIFNQGLHYAKIPVKAEDFDIELAFYADLIQQYQLMNPYITTTEFPFPSLHLHAPVNLHLLNQPSINTGIPILPIFAQQQHPDFMQRMSSYAELLKDHLFKDLVRLINAFPNIQAQLIQQFLIETYLYLSDVKFMQAVHQRIQACLDPTQPQLIVAHSLGSVIAYNVLHQYPQYSVAGLISLASPLAFHVIQEKIHHPIAIPNNLLGDWFNFYSTEDFLTAFPLSEPPFDFNPPIYNQEIQTFNQYPHQIAGYLQHPAVINSMLKILKKA